MRELYEFNEFNVILNVISLGLYCWLDETRHLRHELSLSLWTYEYYLLYLLINLCFLIDCVNSFRGGLYKAVKLAKTNRAKSQGKMKKLFDHRVEKHVFSPSHQVLATHPLVGSHIYQTRTI